MADEEDADNAEENIENEGMWLWHQRMAHVNTRYLSKTSLAVVGMEELKADKNRSVHEKIDCQACCVGKQAKKSISSRQTP